MTFGAPIRRNSAAAQLVVQTTVSYDRAVALFSGSASGGSSAARLSCETMTDPTPRSTRPAPVQRNVDRSDTSIRSGLICSSTRRTPPRAVMT